MLTKLFEKLEKQALGRTFRNDSQNDSAEVTLLFFLKAAWEDVWKGFTAYLTQNPNKIVQIKRVTSLCPLQEYLGNFLGHQRYACLKSSQVSEQCHFMEAKCVITGVTVVELVWVAEKKYSWS